MPAFLCIALGNATKQSLQDSAQGVFCKVITAADAAAAGRAFATEQNQVGRYVAVPAGSLSSLLVSESVTLNVTPEP